ncbi:hypothetical protein J6590_085570 [Homalodisca vitripennis]|nr:hypothetical protein J6590_085570 [Homalodisca vitripennis]
MGGLVSESLFRDINRVPLRREKCSIKTGTADCSGGRAFKYRSGHQLLRGGRKIRLPTDNYVIVVDVNDPVAREKEQCYQYNTFAAPPYKPVATDSQSSGPEDQKCTGQKLKINNRRTNYENKNKTMCRMAGKWAGSSTKSDPRTVELHGLRPMIPLRMPGSGSLQGTLSPWLVRGVSAIRRTGSRRKAEERPEYFKDRTFKISGGVALIGTADD